MGALTRLRQWLLEWLTRKGWSWRAMSQNLPVELLRMLPGLTVGATNFNPLPLPDGTYSPVSNGDQDGEIYLSNDRNPAKAWIWQNGTWWPLVSGTGGAVVGTTYFKYDEDADDTGLYREVTGQPFPTSVNWYTDNTKVTKVRELLITRDGNQKPTTIQWKYYTIGRAHV